MTVASRPARIAVLVSGYGSNLQAIIDAVRDGRIPDAEVCLVVSNRRDAYAMERARAAGIPVEYFPLKPYREAGKSREEYDADLARLVQSYKPDWLVLAGWMHVLSMEFLRHFPNRVINLHPALPGQFPGTHAIQRAHEAFRQGRIAHTGLMVHLVPDEDVDAGPVILERRIPIQPEDTLQDLEERVHRAEHEALVEALRRLVTGEVTVSG
ncbi:MAG: phosphoribosylglycinamide formyltransferase [Anaerolineae bacterium]|nr:phosphoribosylglycinamide formyltransferase [Anaerolineae bacterium]